MSIRKHIHRLIFEDIYLISAGRKLNFERFIILSDNISAGEYFVQSGIMSFTEYLFGNCQIRYDGIF